MKILNVVFLALVFFLTPVSTVVAGLPEPTLTGEERYAAMVAANESPAGFMGVDAYVLTLCVMLNRQESSGFPNTLREVVRDGFYAPPTALTTEEQALAESVFSGALVCRRDLLWAVEEQAVVRLGLPVGDPVFYRVLGSGFVFATHFYSSDPWSDRKGLDVEN